MTEGKYLEDLKLGLKAEAKRQVTAEQIDSFARISGDTNPIHLDQAYAASTPFKAPIAHGLLTASHISAVLGTELPGPGSIYITQTLRFKAPVYVDDEIVTEIVVTSIDTDKGRAGFSTTCRVGAKTVIEGEATLLVPRRPQNEKKDGEDAHFI